MRQVAMLVGVIALLVGSAARGAGDVQECDATRGVQALVCGDFELSDVDRTLADTFAQARRQAGERRSVLDAEQRTWEAAREMCVSDESPWDCFRDRTLRRTAALQARFHLVEASDNATFACDQAGRDLLRLEFFPTGPFTETAVARRHGSENLLWLAPSASGARYVGPGIQVWLWQGQALVRWGKGANQAVCRPS